MRLLVLGQANDFATEHPGYHDGFSRLLAGRQLDEYHHLSYFYLIKQYGWDGLWRKVKKQAAEMCADAIFLHFFHHPNMGDPAPYIKELKSLPSKPVLWTSLGDFFGRWFRRIPLGYLKASSLADLNFLTGMGFVAEQLVSAGAKNVMYMPHGSCQVRFTNEFEVANNPEFDVVFIGSKNSPRNFFGRMFWNDQKRVAFVEMLTKRYGKRLGLFGKGWKNNPAWQGPCEYRQQQIMCRRGAVVVGGVLNGYHDHYMSDREPISIGSGVPFVDYDIPGVDQTFDPGRHWWLVKTMADYPKRIDELLKLSPDERAHHGQIAADYIRNRHTQYHRCFEMVQIARGVLEARRRGVRAAEPLVPCLLEPEKTPGIKPPVILNWQG